jgi:hypothetical protein
MGVKFDSDFKYRACRRSKLRCQPASNEFADSHCRRKKVTSGATGPCRTVVSAVIRIGPDSKGRTLRQLATNAGTGGTETIAAKRSLVAYDRQGVEIQFNQADVPIILLDWAVFLRPDDQGSSKPGAQKSNVYRYVVAV